MTGLLFPAATKPDLGTHIVPGDPLAPDVGSWLFNEGSGALANNFAYQGDLFAGSAYPNQPTWTPDGVSFSGSATFTATAGAVARYGPIPLTISARIKLTTTSGTQELAVSDDYNLNRYFHVRISSGKVQCLTISAGPVSVTGATTLAVGVWYDITATISSTAISVYVNGVLDGTGAGSNYIVAGVFPTLQVGNILAGTSPFLGTLACLNMWSRVLPAADIRSIASNPYQFYPDSTGRYYDTTTATTITATGYVVLNSLTVAGSAALSLAATGHATLAPLTTTGSSGLSLAATGAVNLGGLSDAGTGGLTMPAYGSVVLAGLAVDGTGAEAGIISATGSVTLAGLLVTGSASLSMAATGSVSLGPMVVVGTAIPPLAYGSLIAAIVGTLDATCGAAFGSSTDTPKFFADFLPQGANPLPYCVVAEGDNAVEAQSADDGGGEATYHGEIMVTASVFASGKVEARTLLKSVVTALRDADLTNADVDVLEFRPSKLTKVSLPQTAPRSPLVWQYQADFHGRVREL